MKTLMLVSILGLFVNTFSFVDCDKDGERTTDQEGLSHIITILEDKDRIIIGNGLGGDSVTEPSVANAILEMLSVALKEIAEVLDIGNQTADALAINKAVDVIDKMNKHLKAARKEAEQEVKQATREQDEDSKAMTSEFEKPQETTVENKEDVKEGVTEEFTWVSSAP